MSKRAIILALSLLLVGLLALAPLQAGWAQQAIRLGSAEVKLWPEYDRGGVLVIYGLSLGSDTKLPVTITVSIPDQVTINAVAVKDIDGQLLDAVYDGQIAAGKYVLKIQTSLPDLQIEYYDPDLKIENNQRSFTYQWPGEFAVDELVVEIQQPYDASDLTVTPGPVTSQQDGQLKYYYKSVGAVAKGQAFNLEVNYRKASNRLTVDFFSVEASGDLPESPALADSVGNLWPWALGLMGIFLAAGGGLWFWRSSQQSARPASKRKRARSAGARSGAEPGAAVYCHQCGRRAGAVDRYCRTCGAKLRVE